MRIISQNRSASVEFGNGIIKLDGNYIFFITEHRQEILGIERVRCFLLKKKKLIDAVLLFVSVLLTVIKTFYEKDDPTDTNSETS